MDKEAVLLELIKETRQTLRDMQSRIYNLSTTFVVFSFAITAFALKEAKGLVLPITLFSDIAIASVLLYLFKRIYQEHKLVRLALEKHESVLIDALEGKAASSRDIVAPAIDMKKSPAFSIIHEVNLLLWSAAIVLVKAALVIALRPWLLS